VKPKWICVYVTTRFVVYGYHKHQMVYQVKTMQIMRRYQEFVSCVCEICTDVTNIQMVYRYEDYLKRVSFEVYEKNVTKWSLREICIEEKSTRIGYRCEDYAKCVPMWKYTNCVTKWRKCEYLSVSRIRKHCIKLKAMIFVYRCEEYANCVSI